MLANSLARRRGRGGGETFAARHETGTESQKCGAHHSQCGQTFGACASGHLGSNAVKQAISANLTSMLKQEEACTRSAIGQAGSNWLTKVSLKGNVHKKGSYCADRQFNILSKTHVVSLGHVQLMSSPFSVQKQEKTAHQRLHRHFGLHQHVCGKFFWSESWSPHSLDIKFTDDPSQPSCLQNIPRPFSESVGSLSASKSVVFSELHDVNDMQLQVAGAGPDGP